MSTRLRISVALLALLGLAGCTCGEPSPRDAGAGAVPRDAGRAALDLAAPDAAALAADAGAPRPTDPRQGLRSTIDDLTELLAGRLPAEVDPQTLFEVDLLDEAARGERVDALRRRIEAAERSTGDDAVAAVAAEARRGGEGPDADAGTAETGDGGTLDDTAAEAGDREGGAAGTGEHEGGGATASDDRGRREPGAGEEGPPAGRSGDAGVDAPDGAAGGADAGPVAADGSRNETVRAELARLELERDRLRLRFLSLPAEQRAAVTAAVRRRRRIAVEEEASRAAARRATADAERANEARQDALDRAAQSPSAITRDLLAERARLETARAALAEWEARLARERQAVARRDADRLELTHQLERSLAEGALTPEEADRRYEALVEVLVADRRRLAEALDAIGEPSEVPAFELGIDPGLPLYRNLPERDQLVEAVAAFEQVRTRARQAERSLRWLRAERLAEGLRRLDRLRVALLPHMTRERRETVLGLGSQGLAQAGRELEQIGLMGRFWLRRAWHDLPAVPATVGHLLARSSSRNEVLGALLLGVLLVAVWRRRESITAWLRGLVHASAGGRRWTELVRPFWAVVGPLIVPLVVVAGLHVLFALLGDLTDSIVSSALRIVVLSTAWFFVAVTAVARLFISRLRHGATRAARARRIFGSVRLVLGFGLVVVLMLRLSDLFVGRGYLFTIVVDLAWLFALPLAVLLVHRWSDDVVEAHAERYPGGFCAVRLAEKDTRPRRYAFTVPAAAQLAVLGATTAFKELALRFDQARTAFAFLFRRKLEKRTEAAAGGVDVEELPAALREAFDGQPCEPSLEIDYFPELEPIAERLGAWKEGEAGFAVALIGERGIGKTSWMRALARRAEVEAEVVEVPHGLDEPLDVCRWIGSIFGVDGAETVDALADALEEQEHRRVLLLDHAQNLVVRAIGGTVALETLVELAARTSASTVWVCAFSRYTWLYLERARQAQDLFGRRVWLEAWPEEEIVALIRRRMEGIHLSASFQDLVVDRLAGSALEDAVLRTEGEYLRLLWDYARGNPRVAMCFWLRSLVRTDGELRVRLFEQPKTEALEELHEQSRFLLAAVILHENLSAEEAAQTVGLSRRECAALLAFLAQQGFLEEDEGERWRVSTGWYREVIRFLRRKRLLFD